MSFAFYFLAVLTLGSALAVVKSRSIVHAGYWLLPCFVGIAGLFAALEAHFFFVVQLLIYAGAILVLILFAVMLTRNAGHPDRHRANRFVIPAAIVSLATAAAASWILAKEPWSVTGAAAASPAGQAQALGSALIGMYALPFEIASLVLVAALVGAVVVAKSDPEPVPLEQLVATEPVEPGETLVGARS